MGLDNGVLVKFKNEPTEKLKTALTELGIEKEGDSEYYEVAYFRKFWGWRNSVIDTVDWLQLDGDETAIDILALMVMRNQLVHFCIEDNWNDYEQKHDRVNWIWSYDEYYTTMYINEKCLNWLVQYWRKYPEDIEEVIFYDSY